MHWLGKPSTYWCDSLLVLNNRPMMQSEMTLTDNIGCNGEKSLPTNFNSTPLRRGKWTPEEESYALAVILDFNNGCLDCAAGSSLRTYLSDKLHCDPMRITKKFTGDASIGKKVFHPAGKDDPKIFTKIEKSQAKLEHLYQKWKQRLESQEQEMARKSMADAAVSVASSYCESTGLQLFSTASSACHLLHGVPTITTNMVSMNEVNTPSVKAQKDITETASWLECADTLLSKKTESNLVQKDIEEEMREISRLIAESPAILAISADLPKILDNTHTQ